MILNTPWLPLIYVLTKHCQKVQKSSHNAKKYQTKGHSFFKQRLHNFQLRKTRYSSPNLSKLARTDISSQFNKTRYLYRHCNFLSSQMVSYSCSPSYLPLYNGKWARLKYHGTDKTKGSRNFFRLTWLVIVVEPNQKLPKSSHNGKKTPKKQTNLIGHRRRAQP